MPGRLVVDHGLKAPGYVDTATFPRPLALVPCPPTSETLARVVVDAAAGDDVTTATTATPTPSHARLATDLPRKQAQTLRHPRACVKPTTCADSNEAAVTKRHSPPMVVAPGTARHGTAQPARLGVKRTAYEHVGDAVRVARDGSSTGR